MPPPTPSDLDELPTHAPHRVVRVAERGVGQRADVFLSFRYRDVSRSRLARFIRSGHVRSDQRLLKPSSVMLPGELLRVYIPGIAPTPDVPSLPPVLYEDAWLLVLDKPAGMLVHPVGQRWTHALIGIARNARPDVDLALSHRLDRETSGVVVLTKHRDADRHMKAVFAGRKVQKTYCALVRGEPAWDTFTCDTPLGRALGTAVELRRRADAGGEAARSRFSVARRIGAYSLIECEPLTGRTHQLRAHLEHLGFPILGDKLYGQPDDIFLEFLRSGATPGVRAAVSFPRQALHARSIAFPHPERGEGMTFEAPLPADMRAILDGATPTWPEEPPE